MNDSTPMRAHREILRLRAALLDFMEITEVSAQAPIRDPKYASEIRALGREIGYGALMAGAAAEWREIMRGKPNHPQGTEFSVGPCMAVLLDTRERARRALNP